MQRCSKQNTPTSSPFDCKHMDNEETNKIKPKTEIVEPPLTSIFKSHGKTEIKKEVEDSGVENIPQVKEVNKIRSAQSSSILRTFPVNLQRINDEHHPEKIQNKPIGRFPSPKQTSVIRHPHQIPSFKSTSPPSISTSSLASPTSSSSSPALSPSLMTQEISFALNEIAEEYMSSGIPCHRLNLPIEPLPRAINDKLVTNKILIEIDD